MAPPITNSAARVKAELQHIVDVVRPARLELLIDEHNGPTALANKVDIDPTYITRMRYAVGRKGRKGIGEEVAYQIERMLGLERGWMDGNPHSVQPPTLDYLTPEAVALARAWESLNEASRKHFAMQIEEAASLERTSKKRKRPRAEPGPQRAKDRHPVRKTGA